MKGKKVDNTFVSNFISESVANGKITTNEIVANAHEQINAIDQKIIEVENLKKRRSKLMDVVITFDRNHRHGSRIDDVLIKFHQIKDKKIAQNICDHIFGYKNVSEIRLAFQSNDELGCMKQLIEFNILEREGETIKAGANFSAFKTFLKDNYEVNR